MEILLGVLLLALAVPLAAAAGSRMARTAPSAGPDAPLADEQASGVAGLVLGCTAVALAVVGATVLSSGELTARGLSPYAFGVLAVVGPLVAGVAWQRRAGRRARTARR